MYLFGCWVAGPQRCDKSLGTLQGDFWFCLCFRLSPSGTYSLPSPGQCRKQPTTSFKHRQPSLGSYRQSLVWVKTWKILHTFLSTHLQTLECPVSCAIGPLNVQVAARHLSTNQHPTSWVFLHVCPNILSNAHCPSSPSWGSLMCTQTMLTKGVLLLCSGGEGKAEGPCLLP